MADQEGEFNFFQGIHVRIDIRIDIFISIRPMITNFDKQVHCTSTAAFDSNETNQAVAGDFITLRSCAKIETLYLPYQSTCSRQTWQDGNLS